MKNIMKRVFLLAVFAGLLISCGSAPSSASKTAGGGAQSERNRRQRIYMEALRQEGYSPSIDGDYIIFKREGYTFNVYVGEDDPSYLSLILPQIVRSDTAALRTKAANAISYANRRTKVAKAYFISDNNWVNVATEMYLEDPDDFGVLLGRMFNAATAAMDNVKSQMN